MDKSVSTGRLCCGILIGCLEMLKCGKGLHNDAEQKLEGDLDLRVIVVMMSEEEGQMTAVENAFMSSSGYNSVFPFLDSSAAFDKRMRTRSDGRRVFDEGDERGHVVCWKHA